MLEKTRERKAWDDLRGQVCRDSHLVLHGYVTLASGVPDAEDNPDAAAGLAGEIMALVDALVEQAFHVWPHIGEVTGHERGRREGSDINH